MRFFSLLNGKSCVFSNKNKYVGNIYKRYAMEKKMMKQMMMALLLAMMPFAASAQETPVVQEQADSLLSPSIMVNRHFYVKGLPLDVSKVKSMSAIKYGENGNLMIFTMYPNFTIPKEWEKYEIPRSRVKSLSEIEDQIETYQQMLSLTRDNENADALCGKPLPGSFTLHDLNGKLWTEQSLKGHKVVINAWYSGCGPCLREMPILSEWKNKYPNVIFLSVNFEKADKVRKITEARGFNWTHLYGDNYFVKFVGSGGFPLFIVLGEDGLIRYMVNGTNEKIRQDILNVINK